jgi:hypothetical protein
MISIRFADHTVPEQDLHLSIAGAAGHRFDPGVLGSVRVEPVDVILQLAHEEQQAGYHEGPGYEHQSKKNTVGHTSECRRP